MIRHETVAIYAIADKAMAYALRTRLLAEGRMVWLELNTDPELTVSVHVEVAAMDHEAMTPEQEHATQQWLKYMAQRGVGSMTTAGWADIELS